jgi:hypothetical protein
MAMKKNSPLEVGTQEAEMAKLSLGGLCAYIFRECGEPGLRQVLAALTEPVADPGNASAYSSREMVEDAIIELEQRRLFQVAAILRDIAQQCPSGIDNVPSYYRTSFGGRAVDLWRSKWIQRREIELGLSNDRSGHKLSPNARQS